MPCHFQLIEPNFDEKVLQASIFKNSHFVKMLILEFWIFCEMAIFGHICMNRFLSIDPSKLRTSQGHIKPKISKLGQILVDEMGNLLFTLNVQTPCRYVCRYCENWVAKKSLNSHTGVTLVNNNATSQNNFFDIHKHTFLGAIFRDFEFIVPKKSFSQ